MESVDDFYEDVKIDVEEVVRCLFKAYPNVQYISLNAGLTSLNQSTWRDHWYFVGFLKAPVYMMFQGFPCWVADENVTTLEDEWGMFFMHISSKNHYYKDIPIQEDTYEFASPRWFCWKRGAKDGEIVQYVVDEVTLPEDTNDPRKNLDELLKKSLLEPAVSMLEGKKTLKKDKI